MKSRGREKRLSGLVVLIDKTTYVETGNSKSTSCIVMITEKETGDGVWYLPRIRLSDRIIRSGPQTMAEYIREEMSGRIGFAITDPLTFEEEMIESGRTLLVFSGSVFSTVAVDSIYGSVEAKSLSEMDHLERSGKVTRLHHSIAKRLLAE